MSEFVSERLDSARLLFDLQQGNQIVQSLAGGLSPEAIAQRVTDGLIQHFDCILARIWLVEPDGQALKLVASSGLYTRLNGTFARVPMGAYKVGKIAQNRVSFLSNQLADEAWVRDRQWAIAHQIQGFAGYPLMIHTGQPEDPEKTVLGVLATFSQQPMPPEFLEMLRSLCITVAVMLETSRRSQMAPPQAAPGAFHQLPLSDQLASILPPERLTLIGKEQPLTLSYSAIFLHAADVLNRMDCRDCRLIYDAEAVRLEGMVTVLDAPALARDPVRSRLGPLGLIAASLGGELQLPTSTQPKVQHLRLQLPYPRDTIALLLRIHCRLSVLQLAFTQLAYLAGLQVCTDANDPTVPLLTDDPTQLAGAAPIIWVQPWPGIPEGVRAQIDLSTTPADLRAAVTAVNRGESWGLNPVMSTSLLSYREREMMTLLAQGLRDRDIANQLFISESTVKFHIHNILTKLKARTRYQALHQVVKKGWID